MIGRWIDTTYRNLQVAEVLPSHVMSEGTASDSQFVEEQLIAVCIPNRHNHFLFYGLNRWDATLVPHRNIPEILPASFVWRDSRRIGEEFAGIAL